MTQIFKAFLAACLGALLLSSPAMAATYTLPGAVGTAPFTNCSVSGFVVNCSGSVTLPNNGDIVASSAAYTLNIAGTFNTSNNALIGSAIYPINIIAGGSINIDNNVVIYGDLTATAGTVRLANSANTDVYGNIVAQEIDIGNNASVSGSCIPAQPECGGRNIRLNSVSVAEGTSGTTTATFTATLSSVHTVPVTVNFATNNGSATGGGSCTGTVDYITTSGTRTIPAGSLTVTIPVLVCGDATLETNETFNVVLSAPVNATLSFFSSGVGTIANDDALVDYRFEQCSYNGTAGEVLNSSPGGAYAATSSGALPTTLAGGAVERNLNLTTNNQYVVPSSQIPLPGDYSLSFWIKWPLQNVDSINSRSHVVASAGPVGAGNEGDFFIIRSDTVGGTKPAYTWRVFRNGPGGLSGNYSFASLSAGWHHVVVVGRSGTSDLYVNGTYRDSIARTANSGAVNLGIRSIGAGASDFTTQSLRAPLDEFMVFNSALPAETIASIYNNQRVGNNFDGSTRAATVCSALDNIRVEHDGASNTCGSESVKVKACANSDCSLLFTSGVSGQVAWSGGSSGTSSFSIPSGSSEVSVNLPLTTAGSINFGTSSVTPVPSNTTSSCLNTASSSSSCTMTVTASSSCFDVVEVGANAATPLFTKLAGVGFDLDVVTSSGSAFTGTLNVALVDPSQCSNTSAGLTSGVTTSFTAQSRKTVNFSYAGAVKDVKVRYFDTAPATPQPSCSSDNFAIRPQAFTISNTTPMNPATNRLKAANGADNFTLVANPGVSVGYLTSTPILQNTAVTDHTGTVIQSGWLTGGFANGSGGSVSGIGFKYNEVGTFTMGVNSVVDSSFTSVDSVKNDCVVGSTLNTASSGKFGCNIGNTNTLGPLGRFVPDHFETVVTQSCTAFNYSRQPFTVKVSAYNANGGITTRFDNASSASFTRPVILSTPSATGTLASGTISANLFTAGVATLTNTPVFSFSNPLTVPQNVVIRATMDDDANGVIDTDATRVTSESFSEDSLTAISGRIRMLNANGSELLPLPITVRVENYFTSGGVNGWYTSTVDASCSSLSAGNFAFSYPASSSSFTNNISACTTGVSSADFSGSPPTYSVRLKTPGATRSGSTDLELNLGASATASGDACTCTNALAATPCTSASDTPANRPWLQFNWRGLGLENPRARATFGVSRSGPQIHLREMY